MLHLFNGPGSAPRRVLHPFISLAGPAPRRTVPILYSAAVHAALLLLAVAPYRQARFATIPAAVPVGESVDYVALAVNRTRLERSGPPHRLSRVVPRTPHFEPLDFSFAVSLVSSDATVPDLAVPQVADSVWGDRPDGSRYSSGTGALDDSGLGDGEGVDSMAYIAANVDRSAASDGANPKPAYPADMLHRMVEASFSVYFVVDVTGKIDTSTIQIPPSVHPRFAKAVMDVLVRWRFVPAEIKGHNVRQLMEQPFEFKIVSGQYT